MLTEAYRPAEMIWSHGTIVGNLNESSLYEIWNSKSLYELQKLHLQGRRKEIRACAECYYIQITPDNIDKYADLIERNLESKHADWFNISYFLLIANPNPDQPLTIHHIDNSYADNPPHANPPKTRLHELHAKPISAQPRYRPKLGDMFSVPPFRKPAFDWTTTVWINLLSFPDRSTCSSWLTTMGRGYARRLNPCLHKPIRTSPSRYMTTARPTTPLPWWPISHTPHPPYVMCAGKKPWRSPQYPAGLWGLPRRIHRRSSRGWPMASPLPENPGRKRLVLTPTVHLCLCFVVKAGRQSLHPLDASFTSLAITMA